MVDQSTLKRENVGLTRQEQDNDEGVEDGEPLDVGVRHALQNVVPPGAPLDVVVLLELDREAVGDGGLEVVPGLVGDAHGRLGSGQVLSAVSRRVFTVINRARSCLDS